MLQWLYGNDSDNGNEIGNVGNSSNIKAIKVKVASGNLPPTEYHEKPDLLQEGQGN